METLENRSNIRIFNQIQILNLLRQEKMTITDIASRLNISFTATSHIIDEMIEAKLIQYSNKQAVNTRGRIPVFVELNTSNGVVCAIDFSSKEIYIAIATTDLEILAQDMIPDAMFITRDHLAKVEESIKRLLKSPEVKGLPLLSICISSPGMIRPNTYEYASAYRVKNFDKMNPALYFSNAFGVKVEMHNDIRIASLAELKFGSFPKEPFNGLFIHLSTNSGASLIFNGKIYQGSNSFAGEAPAYISNDPIAKESYWDFKFFSMWDIDQTIRHKRNLPLETSSADYNPTKIIDDYFKGDPDTVEAVQESAKRNAVTLIGLCSLLDVEYVVLAGKMLKFGEEYLNLLRKCAAEFSSSEIRTHILLSKIGEDCSMRGALYQAVSIYFSKTIEDATRKRLQSPSFKINPAFREI